MFRKRHVPEQLPSPSAVELERRERVQRTAYNLRNIFRLMTDHPSCPRIDTDLENYTNKHRMLGSGYYNRPPLRVAQLEDAVATDFIQPLALADYTYRLIIPIKRSLDDTWRHNHPRPQLDGASLRRHTINVDVQALGSPSIELTGVDAIAEQIDDIKPSLIYLQGMLAVEKTVNWPHAIKE